MNIKVHPHKVEITKTPVNEQEVNITECSFEFDEEFEGLTKDAYFTLDNGTTYTQLIQNNKCSIPSEVLTKKGNVELGVVAYEVQNEELIKRYNPSPDYFDTWSGSLKDAENSEPITPTDKEQMEALIDEVQNEMDNLDIDAEKVDTTTTITITGKDGEVKTTVQILDGEKGDKGDKGDAGALKAIKVNQLPTEDIDESAIYLVPMPVIEVQELPATGAAYTIYVVIGTGKRYRYVSGQWVETLATDNNLEYMYVDNNWELVGQMDIEIDLTDYVKNTDYATTSKGGVFKTSNSFATDVSNGYLNAQAKTYEQYASLNNNAFIGKSTLENVITGKNLVSKTDYATSDTGGVITLVDFYNTKINSSNGRMYCGTNDYATYQNKDNGAFVSKGTLENVITGKGLVSNSDYANSSTGGVVKINENLGIAINPSLGNIYARNLTLSQYELADNLSFISKGTLEKVLTDRSPKIIVITESDYNALQSYEDNTEYHIIEG